MRWATLCSPASDGASSGRERVVVLLGAFALSLARLPGYPPGTVLRKPLIRLHSLDSTMASVLASKNTGRNLQIPMEAACSRTMASPR